MSTASVILHFTLYFIYFHSLSTQLSSLLEQFELSIFVSIPVIIQGFKYQLGSFLLTCFWSSSASSRLKRVDFTDHQSFSAWFRIYHHNRSNIRIIDHISKRFILVIESIVDLYSIIYVPLFPITS